ncbi:hypothetical protein [Akkermansia muciniphila]|uniref:hypothetical protein n=1 Tax=Akkermansia muciniphila TaxID=239935 RepID=UPI000CC9A961|nr:hypothetical protein [Akkermansia muciniphila]PNC05692.1 hypothetical protein CXU21_01180 [Akkermansia muciniphila]
MFYKILIVSLPGSPKRETMSQRLSAQRLSWEWVDGVRVASMEDIPWEERNDLEAYGIPRLKQAPEYVCRAIGCKRAMRRAIDHAATCAEDWVLILQDDAILADSFDAKLKELLHRVPDETGCVLLHRVGGGVKEVDGWTRVTGNVRSMTAFVLRPSFALSMSKALLPWGGETDRIWEYLARQGKIILTPAEPRLVSCNQKESDIIGGIPELHVFWK